jgi:hypothetical protein
MTFTVCKAEDLHKMTFVQAAGKVNDHTLTAY